MKVQLIFLVLFVVSTLAHRHRDGDDESQVGSRRHFRGRRRNENQVAANAEDAELEDSISAEDETISEGFERKRDWKGCGRGSRRGGTRGTHRHEFKHDPEWHQKHGVEMTEGEKHNHRFSHNVEWHEKHGQPMPSDNSEVERKHHRHHHHHHPRTTVTTTTSTVPPSLASNE